MKQHPFPPMIHVAIAMVTTFGAGFTVAEFAATPDLSMKVIYLALAFMFLLFTASSVRFAVSGVRA